MKNLEGWDVAVNVRADGSLSLFVSRDDGEDIKAIDEGQVDGQGGIMNVILQKET